MGDLSKNVEMSKWTRTWIFFLKDDLITCLLLSITQKELMPEKY